MGTADPFDNLLEAKQDLARILELQAKRLCFSMGAEHDDDFIVDLLRHKIEVTREYESATNDTPEVCEYSFGGDDYKQLVIDSSASEWQPEEGKTYYVDLWIVGTDLEVACKWTAKHFSAAISPKLWLLTVELCEE